MLHSTNKNAPRTPEEQQRALEEFLASQEPSTESKSGGKGLVKNVKIGKAFGMPKARRPKKPGLRPQLETSTPEQPPPPIAPKPLPPVPIPQGDNNATLPNKPLPPTTGDLIPPKLPEKPPLPTKPLPPVAEKPLLPPSKPEKPNPPPEKPLLPPSKPEKPAKSRLLPPEAAQETSDSHQDIFIRSASKNQPLSPEEQEKAFHEYLASLEKGKQGAPKSPRDNNREESDDKIVIRHTTKNKPLSPEEQAKAFEEYLASLEKEKQEDKTVIIAKTSKNKPLSPEAQQKAMEEFLRQNEQDNSATGLVIKSSSKNRPLTPEEQKIALAEFQARQQLTPQNKNRKNRRISRAFNFSKRMDTTQNIVDEGDNFTPLPKGDEFMKFLIYNHAIVAAGMEAAPRDSQMELAENVLEIFSSQETEHKLISSLLQEVINANDTQSTLFRENTPGTQLFSCYCKLKGREYLDNIFAVFFERLMYRKEALEVDPARTSEAAAEKNTKLLFTLVNDVLDKVFNSQSQFPRCLGKLFHKLQELVASKYPDIVAKMSGGFFFLRFFCPMMLAPHLHGMVNHKLSASCNRSIILCTKIIQNLSNNVTFKTEAHMLPFNEIITGRQEECQAFLLSIGNYENLSDQQLNTPENVIQNRLNKSLRFVANMFGSHYWQFADYLAENFHDQLKPLRIILEQIHKIEAIGWVPAEEAGNVQVPPDDFEISRDAFILLREALHQCEAELKETKIRLEEEITLRESMQTVVVQLADSIHSKIDDRVAFKLEQVSQKAREAGIDQRFCNDILSLCTTDSSNTESAEPTEPSKPIPRIVASPVTEIDMRHTLGGEKKQVLPSHPAPNRGRSRAIGDAPSMEELGVYQLPVAATEPDPYTPYEPDY